MVIQKGSYYQETKLIRPLSGNTTVKGEEVFTRITTLITFLVVKILFQLSEIFLGLGIIIHPINFIRIEKSKTTNKNY